MLKLAHIVNPLVVTNPDSDLSCAQPATLRSMRIARESAIELGVHVTQYAAFYNEDCSAVPADFVPTPVLERSVLDFVELPPTVGGRKLPLLRDILDRLYEGAKDADYLIYSNIDIGLRPDFYLEVARLIEDGTDAFLIGRRIVSTEFRSPDDLEKIFAQEGEPRVGFCCFVFPRAHYPDYLLDDTCIGLQPVGVTLAVNMIQRAAQFRNFSGARLTFHRGDDRVWERTLLDECHRHNERALDRVVRRLARQGLSQATREVLDGYQRWRAGYVIGRTSNPLSRALYRALREAGFVDWVGARYEKVR
jgi:hypothetical protein